MFCSVHKKDKDIPDEESNANNVEGSDFIE